MVALLVALKVVQSAVLTAVWMVDLLADGLVARTAAAMAVGWAVSSVDE
jgi:hypothetical protein